MGLPPNYTILEIDNKLLIVNREIVHPPSFGEGGRGISLIDLEWFVLQSTTLKLCILEVLDERESHGVNE